MHQSIPCPDSPDFTPLDLGFLVLERDPVNGHIVLAEVQEVQEGLCQYTMKVEPLKEYLLVPRTNGFGMHARIEVEEDIEVDIVDAKG